ncbi:MAG: Do family serine endopeptidase [Puniceicoccaceae bacterium]
MKFNPRSFPLIGFPLLALGLLAGTVLWSGNPENGGKPRQEDRPAPTLDVDSSPVRAPGDHEVASYADVLERATPSVVGVVTAQVVSTNRSGPSNLQDLLRRFYGIPPEQSPGDEPRDDSRSEDERRVPVGMGSGVIVSPEGYILTNNHVVRVGRSSEIADEILVQLADDREFTAELVGADERTDIAVLKIEADDPLPHLTIADSERLRVGDVCFAIGNPLQVGLTVTKGIISGLGRTDLGILGMQGYENFIQTDAAINMGNSGGALIDAQGRLIGINTAILSRTGGNIGIGFAIPSSLARYIMESLIDKGEVPRGFLGVVPGDVSPQLAEALGLASTKGALVRQVEEGGAAAEAGVRHGDVITAVDDHAVDSAAELRLTISQTPPGRTVTLTILRDGEEITREATLGSLSEATGEGAQPVEPGATTIPGLLLEPLDAGLREEFSIPSAIKGLVIAEITRVTPANQQFRPGMVISEVNGRTVRTVGEMEEAIRPGQNSLYVWFNGVYDYLAYLK